MMIGSLKGLLVAKTPPQVLLDVNGVGYEVDVPMSTFYGLPEIGDEVFLRTHLAIREDAHCLYGFLTETERKAFRQLLKISGIGARTAMGVLSGMSVGELADAIARQDVARFVKVPGIGKKTAERLLLELKDSVSKIAPGKDDAPKGKVHDVREDVISALVALGYSAKEAAGAGNDVPPDADVASGIRLALKALAK